MALLAVPGAQARLNLLPVWPVGQQGQQSSSLFTCKDLSLDPAGQSTNPRCGLIGMHLSPSLQRLLQPLPDPGPRVPGRLVYGRGTVAVSAALLPRCPRQSALRWERQACQLSQGRALRCKPAAPGHRDRPDGRGSRRQPGWTRATRVMPAPTAECARYDPRRCSSRRSRARLCAAD